SCLLPSLPAGTHGLIQQSDARGFPTDSCHALCLSGACTPTSLEACSSPAFSDRISLSELTGDKCWPTSYIGENEMFSDRVASDSFLFHRWFRRHLPCAGSCSPGLCHYPSAFECC